MDKSMHVAPPHIRDESPKPHGPKRFDFEKPEPRFVDNIFSKNTGERAVFVSATRIEKTLEVTITIRAATAPRSESLTFKIHLNPYGRSWIFPFDGKEYPAIAVFKRITGGIEGHPASRLIALQHSTIARADHVKP